MSVKFKISTFELFKNVSCSVKNLKFRTKNALFRYFGEQIVKDIYICYQHPQSEMFHEERKKSQFGSEAAFFKLTLKKLLIYFK